MPLPKWRRFSGPSQLLNHFPPANLLWLLKLTFRPLLEWKNQCLKLNRRRLLTRKVPDYSTLQGRIGRLGRFCRIPKNPKFAPKKDLEDNILKFHLQYRFLLFFPL